uniref:NADH-ubiquinone oxidoreductase chain 6 n=1 Tax=Spongicola levigatus TaxID=1873861 RepID=A0A3S6FE98_9EUCA|nr:NADH dehydrogenase subunit 6 [Spongicola levigatus]
MTFSISLIPIIILISIIFLSTTHPLATGITLLSQTALICLMSSLFMTSSWVAYILFLIFLGGMLVLFIYVTSLIPNEPLLMSLKMIILTMASISLSILTILWDPLMKMTKTSTPSPSFLSTYWVPPQTLTTKMMYSMPISNLTLFIIIYLLLTLIVIVKITDHSQGTLRLTN